MRYVPKQLERTVDVSRGRTDRWEVLTQGIQVSVALALLYLGLGYASDFIAERIPSDWEARAAWSVPVGGADPRLERAQGVLDRLLVAGEMRALPYQVVMIPADAANAFAFPGGTIGITSGLLDQVESEQGLAMVIGHELGHHHQRHVIKRLGRLLLIVAPVMALSADAGRLIVDLLNLSERKYSRDQESEADRIGLELVASTYGNIEGALEFFELMLEEQGAASPWSALAATHPPTHERVEALREQAKALSQTR